MPFGIAQIGKAFRNEINPRNFTFRSREFEQAEMEFFVPPGPECDEWFEHWQEERLRFHRELGFDESTCARAPTRDDELAHYANARPSTSSSSSPSAGRRSRGSTTAAAST